MDDAQQAYLAAYLSGRDVLLMAQSHDTCRELSQQIRADLPRLGRVETGAEAQLSNGAWASVGNLVITKKNDHNIGVANGDTWRVEAIDGDQITMRQLVDADRESGQRRYADRTVTYRDGKNNADLAYAVTGHSSQGRTVAEGLGLITGTETREWAYVVSTRGVYANHLFVVTDPARVADPAPGTRPAPRSLSGRRASTGPAKDCPSPAATRTRPPSWPASRSLSCPTSSRTTAPNCPRSRCSSATWPTPTTWASCTLSGTARPRTRSPDGISACCANGCPKAGRTPSFPAA